MSNMSYCMFRNTESDLQGCYEDKSVLEIERKIMTYEKLMQELESAKKFISKIGAAQPHFESDDLGKLYELKVGTTIHHQAYRADTNSHRNRAFDEALAEVITEQFLDLAGEALILMETRANNALVAEEQALRERLRKIEEVKEKEAHV